MIDYFIYPIYNMKISKSSIMKMFMSCGILFIWLGFNTIGVICENFGGPLTYFLLFKSILF